MPALPVLEALETMYINKEQLLAHLFSKQEEPMDVMKEIAEFPAADVAPVVHARRVESRHRIGFYMCSACKSNDKECQCFYSNTWNYCPNCGAKMGRRQRA